MVKAYLKYIFDQPCGAISGNNTSLLLFQKQFISACGQYVIFIDKKTGEIQSKLINDKNIEITQLCIVNQQLAIGYQDGDIILWDLIDSKVISIFYGHKASITSFAYSLQSHTLYSGSLDNCIIIWDLIGEELSLKLSGHTSAITSLQLITLENAYSAEMKEYIVSGSKDGLVKIWDLDLEQSIETITSMHSEVLSLEYMQDRNILIIGSNSDELIFKKIIQQHDKINSILIEDEGIYKRNSFSKPIQIIYQSTESIIYILTSDKKIESYRIKPIKQVQKKLNQKQKLQQQTIDIKEIHISQQIINNNILTLPQKVKSMNIFTDKIKAGLQIVNFGLSFAKNSIEVRSLSDQNLWLEQDDKAYNIQILGNQAAVRKLYISENDSLLLALCGQEAIIYDPNYCQALKRVHHNFKYTSCTFLPKNRYYLLGDTEGQLQVMDFNSGEQQQILPAHQTTINNITYHPNIKKMKGLLIMTTGLDKQIKFWEVYLNNQTKKIQLQENNHIYMNDDINFASFSSKGEYYAISFLSNIIKIFFTDTHKIYLELYGHALPVLQFSITSDDALIISGGQDKNIKIWGMDFGDCRKSLKAHQDQVTIIQAVNETHYFFSGSKDRTVKYWDGDTYELIMQFDECISEITSFAIGILGDTFFVGSNDKIIRKYIQTKEQLYITDEEEKRVDKMLIEDYQKTIKDQLDDNQEQQNDNITKQQVIQSKIPQLRSAEDLMNVLEQIINYRKNMEEEDIEQTQQQLKEKLILFNYQDPTLYLFKQLQNIPATSIPSVLRFVHIKYFTQIMQEMNTEIAINLFPQLTSNILNYLLINQEGQLFTSNDNIQNMIQLKDKLKLKLQKEQETAEFNLVALDIIIKQIQDEKDNVEFL